MMVWRRYAPPGPAPEKAPLYGPSGVAMRIGAASSEFPGEIDDISDTFDVHEWADGMEITLGGMNIHAIKLDHPPETYGLRVTGPEGHVIAFSGDTGPCDELIDLAADATCSCVRRRGPMIPATAPSIFTCRVSRPVRPLRRPTRRPWPSPCRAVV